MTVLVRRSVLRPATWLPLIAAVAAFLVSRLLFLDADLPGWKLTQYSPIDEFGYSVPAFNLYHYGTWTHQAAPWAPVEGWPMNIVQNIVAFITMRLAGYTYWGLRASSVLFGLLAFVALLAIVRRLAAEACGDGSATRRWAIGVTVAAALVLIADFSFLLGGRVVEPTVVRLAAVAILVWLVMRGTFLSPGQGVRRSAVLGAFAAAIVLFVYIYNFFVLPGTLVACFVLAWRAAGTGAAIRHASAFLVGAAVVTLAYFLLMLLVYQQSPLDWYRVWLGSYGNSTRFAGPSFDNVRSLLDANVLRLDRALMVTCLLSLPVFVAWALRVARPWAVLTLGLLSFFVLQSAVVADYPIRKFLVLLAFAMPIAASGVLRGRPFVSWLTARRALWVPMAIWAVAVASVTALNLQVNAVGRGTALVLQAGGWLGLAAALGVFLLRRPTGRVLAGIVLLGSMVVPLLAVDRTIYLAPTYTYRDAMIAAGAQIDGKVTAGSLSFGMQLYNTSLPVLNGYVYGPTRQEYLDDVVRLFQEGGADSLFEYPDPRSAKIWVDLGFRVEQTYSIKLPTHSGLARLTFDPGAR